MIKGSRQRGVNDNEVDDVDDNIDMEEINSWWSEVSNILGSNSDSKDLWGVRDNRLKEIQLTVNDVKNVAKQNDDRLIHNLLQNLFLEPIYGEDISKFNDIVSQGKIEYFVDYYNGHKGYRCSRVLDRILF
jgi:hypothetical protein